MKNLVLCRYGELALKGRNRADFEKKLIRSIKSALSPLGKVEISTVSGRILVRSEIPFERLREPLGRVFGLVGFSPALAAGLDLGEIKEAALELLREDPPLTFKVESRRSNKAFPLTSPEISREVGAYLLKNVPGLSVDVHNPQVTVRVEVREKEAFVFAGEYPGPGGLPYGSSGRALLLLSGGIDSPVAGWYGMRRGIDVEGVHFESFPFTTERAAEKVFDIARVLSAYSGRFTINMVHFTEIQKAIQLNCPEDLRITIMRRFMFRIAGALAEKRHALALITGESIGQVASQTLESMGVIEEVTLLPVLRPLSGLDKQEIVRKAREIGTYEISIRPYEDCCTLFTPRNPKTRPRLEQARRAEERLDVEGLLADALENTKRLTFPEDE